MFDWFQPFWDWLAERIQTIIDLISPMVWFDIAYQYFLSFLPFQNLFFQYAILNFFQAYLSFMPYIKFAALFVDVPFMAGCVGITFSSEVLMLVFRTWRAVRSLAT